MLLVGRELPKPAVDGSRLFEMEWKQDTTPQSPLERIPTRSVYPVCSRREMMSSDRSNPDRPRPRSLGGELPSEVTFFTAKHGISIRTARELIDRFGPSRARCDEAAERRKKR
jgi:hypothetical protein